MADMGDGEQAALQYDAMAQAYAADNEDGPFNAYYERPATISLLGDVRGRRVLELGCGAGPLTGWLIEHEARVSACDVSPAMVTLARQRAGEAVDVRVADIARPLPFPDRAFDLVVASLVLHYVRDWSGVLAEVRRVLAAAGTFVFSTHHPTMDWPLASPEDYFAVRRVDEVWEKRGERYTVSFWRRPLTAMCEAIADEGFVIERMVEPMPRPELEAIDPGAFETLTTRPRFLFFVLRPMPEGGAPQHAQSSATAT